MKITKFASMIFVSAMLLVPMQQAQALSILFESGSSMDVEGRLTGLGHELTLSDATTWNSTFDYSIYDLVVFEYGSQDPADINHLVNSVSNNDVGVVFFRGYGVESTIQALGLASDTLIDWQAPVDLNIIDNTHEITSFLDSGVHDLGFSYMTEVGAPGIDTTVLGTGSSGASLVVHNTLRAAIAPFYGHDSNYDQETADSIQLTENVLQWAAGDSAATHPVSAPATALLLSLGIIGLMATRKRNINYVKHN